VAVPAGLIRSCKSLCQRPQQKPINLTHKVLKWEIVTSRRKHNKSTCCNDHSAECPCLWLGYYWS